MQNVESITRPPIVTAQFVGQDWKLPLRSWHLIPHPPHYYPQEDSVADAEVPSVMVMPIAESAGQ